MFDFWWKRENSSADMNAKFFLVQSNAGVKKYPFVCWMNFVFLFSPHFPLRLCKNASPSERDINDRRGILVLDTAYGTVSRAPDSLVPVGLRSFVGFVSCVARSGSYDRLVIRPRYATFVREIRLVRPLSINARRSFRCTPHQRILQIRAAVHVMGYREAESVATLALWLIVRSTHLSLGVDKCVSVRIYAWQEWDCTLKNSDCQRDVFFDREPHYPHRVISFIIEKRRGVTYIYDNWLVLSNVIHEDYPEKDSRTLILTY